MSTVFDDPSVFRSLLENLPVGICLVDIDRRVRFWNRGAEHITGHLAHEMVGQHEPGNLLKPCDRHGRLLRDEHCPLSATLQHGEPQQFFAFYLHKNGHRVAVRVRVRAILQHQDLIIGAISLFEEAISFREDASGALMYGCLDAMTGVPSQRLTRAVLRECLAGVEEAHSGFGLLRVRVLGLCEFGSKHGALSMVPLLRTTAQTIRHNLDGESFLGRWGENQFLAILPSASPMILEAVADRVRRLLSQSEVSWWGDHFRIEAEVESTIVRSGDTLESLLADTAEPAQRAAKTASPQG